MFFLNDLERPVMLADVAGLFTSNGSYAQALQHVIEEAERAANKRKLSIPDGTPLFAYTV